MSKAKLIILDEPTSGLDQKVASLVAESIKEISRTSTTIIVTHDNYLLGLADEVIDIGEGYVG